MYQAFNVQYLTNEQGVKTAVMIPINEWSSLMKDYLKLKQTITLKKELKSGLKELIEINEGKKREVTLIEFLNEN